MLLDSIGGQRRHRRRRRNRPPRASPVQGDQKYFEELVGLGGLLELQVRALAQIAFHSAKRSANQVLVDGR